MVEQREIGRAVGAAPGPTVIVVAGIHGNEPAGVHGARRFFARLGSVSRGEVVALAGNLGGIRAGVRYQARDLNRVWTPGRLGELRASGPRDAEDREQLELAAAIDEARARARGPVYMLDIHTTSAAGIPFMLFGDTPRQQRFVGAFPIPAILGLEDQLDGVLSAYWSTRGCITAAVEGGKHDDPATVDSVEAVLWLALAFTGLIDSGRAEVASAAALLDERRGGLPLLLEVLSRHAIAAGDGFCMEPGFRNIDRAGKGRLLARDRGGEIRAPRDGLIIMPLYQGLGGDGFFWGREVGRLRLAVASALRRLGLARLLGLLPGVARTGSRGFVSSARWAGLFRLLGYRRLRESGGKLTVERDVS